MPPALRNSPVRYAGNPIIENVADTWYAANICDMTVLINPLNTAQLLMYCSGQYGPENGEISIGLFTAARNDPYTWTEYGQILRGIGGKIVRLGPGGVVYSGGVFYLFYTEYEDATFEVGSINLATSTDGFSFTRYASNPVMTASGSGRNDGNIVSEPSVILEAGVWSMLYSYRNGVIILPGFRAATASAPTGPWTKVGSGDVLTGAPLFTEDHQINKVGSLYVLTYDKGSEETAWSVNQATATTATGIYTNTGPILQASGVVGTFDRYGVATACYFPLDGVTYLFYQGAGDHLSPYSTNHWQVGVAVYENISLAQRGF